jgi:hypothetical protein
VKRLWLPAVLIAIFIAIAVYGYRVRQPHAAVAIACPDIVGGCPFVHEGRTARLGFSVIPRPLEAFTVQVRAPGARRVSAEFQMIGMDMGFNRYDLVPGANDTFSARVTLPVCVSSRHDWVLYLDIDGARYAARFSSR